MCTNTFCPLQSTSFTWMCILCLCFAIKYPEHARKNDLPHTAISSPTSYSFKSVTFVFLNAASAEGLHCEEGNSRRTPVITLHEILTVPKKPPSKIQVYHAKERTISGSPKRQSELPPKSKLFLKKGPPLGSLPVKPDHEAVFREWIEFLLTQLMSAACSPLQGFQEQIGLHRHILSDFMHSEALRHKILSSEGHWFSGLLSPYVLLQTAHEQILAPWLGLPRTSPLLSRAM